MAFSVWKPATTGTLPARSSYHGNSRRIFTWGLLIKRPPWDFAGHERAIFVGDIVRINDQYLFLDIGLHIGCKRFIVRIETEQTFSLST